MLLNLRELHAFQAIAEHGSLGRAAEALSLTQPALTRILKRLESQLGVPLFERHPHGMALTAYGAALQPHAALMLQGAQQAVRAVGELQGLAGGTVRVGAVASAVEHLLPPAIDRLLAAHPGLQVQIVEGLSDELLLALARGDVDLALGFSAAAREEVVLVSESEWQEGCHVVCATGHPLLAGGGPLRLEDLAGARWVLPPRRLGPREEWQQLFWDHGLEAPPVAVEARSINAIRALVAGCGFLSWMPRLLLDAHQHLAQPLAVLPVQEAQAVVRSFALYQRRHGLLSPAAARLRDELLQQVAQLPAMHGGRRRPARPRPAAG